MKKKVLRERRKATVKEEIKPVKKVKKASKKKED